MRKSGLLVMLVSCCLLSCSKGSDSGVSYTYTGKITGPDLGTTVCSGGYLIEIDGIPDITRLNSVPASSGINLSTATFPVRVKLNWHYQNANCGIIAVDAIVKVN